GGDRGCGVATGKFERLAERLARIGAAAGAADRGSQLQQRERVLEPRRRLLQAGDRFLEQLDSGVAFFDEPERSQCRAEARLCAEGAAALELLAGKRTSLVDAVERCQEGCGIAAPGAKRGRPYLPLTLETSARQQIFERVLRLLRSGSDASARLEVPHLTRRSGLRPNPCKRLIGRSRVAARKQHVDERHVGVEGLGTGLLQRARRIGLRLRQ